MFRQSEQASPLRGGGGLRQSRRHIRYALMRRKQVIQDKQDKADALTPYSTLTFTSTFELTAYKSVMNNELQRIKMKYGSLPNPRLTIAENAEQTLSALNSPIKNLACHNLCESTVVSPAAKNLLGHGLNFCVSHQCPQSPDLNRFERDVRTRSYFVGQDNSDYIKKLHVKSKDWDPPVSNDGNIEESLFHFRQEIEKQVASFPEHPRANLTYGQRRAIKDLRDDENLFIIPSDKNLGPVVLERSVYIRRCLDDHLLDATTYRRLDPNEARKLRRDAVHRLSNLTEGNKEIFPKGSTERKYFIRHLHSKTEHRESHFYGAPKIHKTPWKLRPVVSTCGSFVEAASVYIDYQLQRVVHLCPGYIKDSWELLDRLKKLPKLRSNARIVTADATSMYSNIDIDHGVETISAWLLRHRNDDTFPDDLKGDAMIKNMVELLRYVMEYNVFNFDDTCWLQIKGTAMGTSVACMYATIYFSFHEETTFLSAPYKTENRLKLLLYVRLIDDACLIVESDRQDECLETLTQTFNGFGREGKRLEWTLTPLSMSVDFLDLTISIGEDGRMVTRSYQKPRFLALYIPPSSAHHPSVLNSLVYSQIRRFSMQNTHLSDFKKAVNRFFHQLLERGHDRKMLADLFKRSAVRFDDRNQDNVSASTHDDSDIAGRIFLHLQYHPNQVTREDIRRLYRETCQDSFQNENCASGIKRLTIAFSRAPNLRDSLCRTRLKQPEGSHVSNQLLPLDATTVVNPYNRPW
jgi:hypothetical protein